ncbi:MAG: hypothetical protein ACRESY_12045, partial [Steroidobacteraceae bacterium]
MTLCGSTDHRPAIGWLLGLALAAAQCATPAAANDDPCSGFRWDMARERTLFASVPQTVVAGRDPKHPPALVSGRLYELQLSPQAATHPALPPGKRSDDQHSFAG